MIKLAYILFCFQLIPREAIQSAIETTVTPSYHPEDGEYTITEAAITDTKTNTALPASSQVHETCGHRNPYGVGLHLDDGVSNVAKFGEFPWMTAILKVEPLKDDEPNGEKINVYIGGGSLINPNVVLTAAHIVDKNPPLRVRVGEWDTQTKMEIYPHQDINVKEIVLHADLKKSNLHNDVALLFLSEPVNMSNPNVGLACLAKDSAVAGSQCLASGWGKNKFGKEGRYSAVLKRVELPVVDHDVCQEKLRGTRLGERFVLDSSFMCAGGEPDKDTCKGDGGSPLVCPVEGQKDRYVQNGIVSWGIGCGNDGVPAAYADVARLRSWIDENVAKHGYDTKSYTL